MKELNLTAEIMQNTVALYAYSRGGCRVKAVIFPAEGGFRVLVWEGDGKTSNSFDTVNLKNLSTAGFKPIHEGSVKTVLGCMIVIEAYFEKLGKSLSIVLRDGRDQAGDVERLGLQDNFTDQGVFYSNKETVRKTRSPSRLRRAFLRLSDKIHGFREGKAVLALTGEQLSALEKNIARLP